MRVIYAVPALGLCLPAALIECRGFCFFSLKICIFHFLAYIIRGLVHRIYNKGSLIFYEMFDRNIDADGIQRGFGC